VPWFLAMVSRIADILAVEGDPDPVEVRKSKAIGILAQPAEALAMLLRHRGDNPHPADPTEPDPGGHGPNESESADPTDARYKSVRFDAPLVDPDRCRPRAVIYVHLAEEAVRTGVGVARVEDYGPLLVTRLHRLLGNQCQITVRPVLDLAEEAPVDRYEVPARLREVLRLRTPASVFPYGVNTGRRMDADHIRPFLAPARGGPPGQTRIGNLGFLVRSEHRAKTFGRWRVRQPEPGKYLWRDPCGYAYLVDHRGTHPLGKGPLADTLWRAVIQLDQEPGDAQAATGEQESLRVRIDFGWPAPRQPVRPVSARGEVR
ncbi:MAG: hypothetical protein ACLGIF_07150, partial [Actinomycetes bacterium]